MVYKRFYINLIFRVVLIVGNALLMAFTFYYGKSYLFTHITLLLVLALQAALLINYIGKINRNIAKYLLTIREQNLSFSLADMSNDKTFKEISDYFSELNEIIGKAKREQESHWLYLKYVIEHVDVGIIAFDKDGDVQFTNPATINLFRLNTLKHLNDLQKVDSTLPEFIRNLKVGEEKLRKISIENQVVPLAFKTSLFTILGQQVSLVSFQNIKTQLDENELDSWQKLIRVLTHEIMNSVAPLSSLTSTLKTRYAKVDNSQNPFPNDPSLWDDTLKGLGIIENRSKGLLGFVGNYRKLTRIPKLERSIVRVSELLESTVGFMQNDAEAKKIHVTFHVTPSNLEFKVDNKLLEQVLINLIKNALESFDEQDNKEINIKAFRRDNGSVEICVIDNGPGISPEVMDKIFVPFFTTKGQGSGIGLSFARQVMQLHGGSISAFSAKGKGTSFSLVFN